MFVSIIIPSYNHALYLQERIESILNQSFQNFEMIILDDKSPDDSHKIIKKYENHPKVSHCIINKKNSGSTFFQWNKGLELAKGELIWIAESDDIADHEFLATLIPQFEKNPQLVLAYSQSYRMNATGEITGTWKSQTDPLDLEYFNQDFTQDGLHYIERFLCHENTIPNASAVLFKKDTYIKVGGAATSLKYIGDWDIWTKIVTNGDIYFNSEPLNYFRYHDKSVIAQVQENLNHKKFDLEEQLIIFRKNIINSLKNNKDKTPITNIKKFYTNKLNISYKKIIKESYRKNNKSQANIYIEEFKNNITIFTLLRFNIKWWLYRILYKIKNLIE